MYVCMYACMYVCMYVYIYQCYNKLSPLPLTRHCRFPHPKLVQGEVIGMRCFFTKETGNIEDTSPL